jgi:phage terminase small subunit
MPKGKRGGATPRRTWRQGPKREAAFIEQYLIDMNGAAAARRAGYPGRSANVRSAELLAKPHVKAEIDARIAARAVRTGIDAERVLKETEAIAFSSIDHYLVDEDGVVTVAPGAPANAMSAIQSIKRKQNEWGVEVEIKLWNKPEVLKLAGRHVDVKGFWDRMEVTGKDGAALGPVTEVKVVIVSPKL